MLLRRHDTIGQLFAIYFNVLPPDRGADVQRTAGPRAGFRASQWLRHACAPAYEILPPLEPWELSLDTSDAAWKQAIKEFARAYGRGTVVPEVLHGVDYVGTLGGEGGSYFEMIFAVFSNVLLIDEQGRPLKKGSHVHPRIRGHRVQPETCVCDVEAELW